MVGTLIYYRTKDSYAVTNYKPVPFSVAFLQDLPGMETHHHHHKL